MKLLILAAAALAVQAGVWANRIAVVETGFVHARDAFVLPEFVGPVPHRFNVVVTPIDLSVTAFRVTVYYEYDGNRLYDTRVIPSVPEHGSIASFAVPDVNIKVLDLNIGPLRESRPFSVPQ